MRGGDVWGGSLYYVGSDGYLWSQVSNSSAGAYNLGFNSGGVYPSDTDYRYVGFPLRCVAIGS